MEYGETRFADMTEDELRGFVMSGNNIVIPRNDKKRLRTIITSKSIRERMKRDERKRGTVN